jgi:hypothetical protein
MRRTLPARNGRAGPRAAEADSAVSAAGLVAAQDRGGTGTARLHHAERPGVFAERRRIDDRRVA